MKFIEVKLTKLPRLKDAKLIEGLPGIGNVGRLVADIFITQLKAKKVLELYCYSLPNSVFVNEDGTIDLPKVEFYVDRKRNLAFVVGDAQPTKDEESYEFTEKILSIAKRLGVKEIISIGGISLDVEPEKPRVFGAFTHKTYESKLRKIGVRFDRNGSLVVIGVAGLLLGLAKLKKMKGFALLAETSGLPGYIGLRAGREVINILNRYLKTKVSTKELDEEIAEIDKKLEKTKKLMEKFTYRKELSYIG